VLISSINAPLLHPGVCWPQEEGQILSISVDFPLLRFSVYLLHSCFPFLFLSVLISSIKALPLPPGVCWPQEEGQILSISVDFPLLRLSVYLLDFLYSFPVSFRANFFNQSTTFASGSMLATRRRLDSKHFRSFSTAWFLHLSP
jgi:hypothetical protein